MVILAEPPPYRVRGLAYKCVEDSHARSEEDKTRQDKTRRHGHRQDETRRHYGHEDRNRHMDEMNSILTFNEKVISIIHNH